MSDDGPGPDDEVVILCVRWRGESAHVRGSAPMSCTRCGTAVAVSPAAQRFQKDLTKCNLYCPPCMLALHPNEIGDFVPGSREEVRRELGEEGFIWSQELRQMPIRELGIENL